MNGWTITQYWKQPEDYIDEIIACMKEEDAANRKREREMRRQAEQQKSKSRAARRRR